MSELLKVKETQAHELFAVICIFMDAGCPGSWMYYTTHHPRAKDWKSASKQDNSNYLTAESGIIKRQVSQVAEKPIM